MVFSVPLISAFNIDYDVSEWRLFIDAFGTVVTGKSIIAEKNSQCVIRSQVQAI